MTTKVVLVVSFILLMPSCEFSKTLNKDLVTGMVTNGTGLSCDEVYLSSGEEKISRSSFTYGEKIYVSFDNIEGFKKKEGNAIPGLQMLVTTQSGDTILNYPDLYAKNDQGFNLSPLALSTNLIVADPLHSRYQYKLQIYIWDKNGTGKFSATMDFSVSPNQYIEIESKNISYNEIYLYSRVQGKVLTGNTIPSEEDVYLIFEGLKGFVEEGEMVFPGLSMMATDADGKVVLDESDLVGEGGMESSNFSTQLAPSFIFSGANIKNPIACEVVIWDKKGENSIRAKIELNVE